MPLSAVKSNSRRRFAEVQVNLNFIESLEPKDSHDEVPVQVKILKGFYYVHLYAALERTINEVVEQTLLLINSEKIANKHYLTQFNAISLNAKMQGFKSCGFKDYFTHSTGIFNSVDSNENFDISNTIFEKPLQNVWYATLQQVLICFGIPEIEVEPRIRTTIDEVVDKRNAVAHGREMPAAIGERYRSNVLRAKTGEIQLIVDKVIDRFETYISQKGYIKEIYRETYIAA